MGRSYWKSIVSVQPVNLSTSKCKSLVHQRKKPSKLMWTQAWRRLNKKGKEEGVVKKKYVSLCFPKFSIFSFFKCASSSNYHRSRKAVRVQRAIVGASIDEVIWRGVHSRFVDSYWFVDLSFYSSWRSARRPSLSLSPLKPLSSKLSPDLRDMLYF